jgi:hypothetical protein
MTYIDPNAPLPPREVVVRREGGATGWFVAGAVAIVAMVAVAFMLTVGARTPSQDQIAQAQEQGRAIGAVEGQTGAAQATIVAQQAARDATSAADSARRSTEITAANAAQAAHDAADRAAVSRDDTVAPSADPTVQAPPAQPVN